MAYKYVPVAKEDTYKLIDAAQNGDRRARDLVVDQNIGLVKNLAMKYASGYYEPEDLMQVGFVGLVKAIDRFDTGYNVMFSTYAVPMIMGEIKRYIRDDGKIKIGRQLKTEMKRLKDFQQEYYHKYGVSPKVSWLADKMGISREHVLEILEAIESVSSVESLDNAAIPEGMRGGEYVDEEAQNVNLIDLKAAIRELEQYALQSSGYDVQSFESSESFWQAMNAAVPELVILDVMLPGEDGFSILKKLRNTPSLRRLPIIMVTAKSSELDTVRGLDCGADDYITKPFGIMEFLSRVRAALRRSAPEEKTNVYAFHEILLDNARHIVTVNDAHIDLTYKEYSLLRLLLENTNLVVTRETILQVVWGTDISVESRTVDMHIRTLRKKLGDAGKYICTVRKVGYKLADNEEENEE